MLDFNRNIEHCSICRHEYTSAHIEARPGLKIYVCENCIEAAEYNFIWICLNCGKVYIRPKALMIKRINNYGLYEDMQVIQGIDMCIECDPEGIINFMNTEEMGVEC